MKWASLFEWFSSELCKLLGKISFGTCPMSLQPMGRNKLDDKKMNVLELFTCYMERGLVVYHFLSSLCWIFVMKCVFCFTALLYLFDSYIMYLCKMPNNIFLFECVLVCFYVHVECVCLCVCACLRVLMCKLMYKLVVFT